MNSATPSRSNYWDVVKGLGIIAIVLGHSCHFIIAFVYLFHLALFFFVSGYLYNEKKYGDSPFLYFGVRLAGSWPRYVFYAAIFVLAHNFFIRQGLYANQEIYNHTMMLTAICNSMSLSNTEPVQGALWFIPVWLVSSGIFAGTVWFGRMLSHRFDKPELKLWLMALANLGIGLVGVFLNMRKCGISYNLQTALLVVPLYFFAYLIKNHLPDFKKYLTWYGCIITGLALYLINTKLYIFVELASMNIPGMWFFPISVIGIYFVLSLAALAEKLKGAAKLLSFLGRYSFEIMALHFAVFKIIDLLYARLWLKSIPPNLAAAPVSFTEELWIFYLFFGTLFPAAVGWVYEYVSKQLFLKKQSPLPR